MTDEIPENEWTIFVQIDKKRSVSVPMNCSVDSLLAKICGLQPINNEVKAQDIVVWFAEKQLEYGKGKRLSDYKIQQFSLVVVTLRLPGGIWPTQALQLRKITLQPLPGYITVTSSESNVDMISLDADPNEKRAIMPCGHCIGPVSMTQFCHSLLSEGRYIFRCPYVSEPSGACGREWPYFLVRHVACLTSEENQDIELNIAQNYMKKASGFKQCPGCSIWCQRQDPSDKRVRCMICSKTRRTNYEFCWECSKEWRGGGGGGQQCGNMFCDGKEDKIRLLSECPMKEINGVQVPSRRACPQCGILIEHKEACRHMTCKCRYEFCFICLQPCMGGVHKGECKMAARQTSIA